jgi:hypothetical protein
MQLGVSADPGVMTSQGPTSLGVSVLNPNTMGSGKFVSVPHYQAILSPRMSGGINVGANIRYNAPDRKNMAVPCEPLTFKNSVEKSQSHESFCANCGSGCAGGCPPSCGKGGYGMGHKIAGGYELPPGYTNGNHQDHHSALEVAQESAGDMLPVGTMTTTDSAGSENQFVTFNRLVYSPRPVSRLYGQQCWIRGSPAITPCNSGWFSVYPTISTDLNPGAMGVLAGPGSGGESHNKLIELLVQASGGAKTTFSGVDHSEMSSQDIDMNAQSSTNLQAAMSDVSVSVFP